MTQEIKPKDVLSDEFEKQILKANTEIEVLWKVIHNILNERESKFYD